MGISVAWNVVSGEGKEDVSDQIEDEEQLLGLKGEEETETNENEEADEKGMEMENDFEGEMYDMPDDNDQQEDDKEEEEEEQLDREMGDLNEDEQVVDEKMWGDDDDDDDDGEYEEKEKEKEKFEEDSAV